MIQLKIVTNITHILLHMFTLIYKTKIVKSLCFKKLKIYNSIYRMQNLRKVICQSQDPQQATEGKQYAHPWKTFQLKATVSEYSGVSNTRPKCQITIRFFIFYRHLLVSQNISTRVERTSGLELLLI